MVSSLTFWAVLAGSVLVYWMLPGRLRLGFLGSVSVLYLATLDLLSVAVLLGWVSLFYWVAPLATARNRRAFITGSILAVLGFLAAFKYVPPLLHALAGDTVTTHEVLVPLGIIYYTFKLVHYLVELGRGNIRDRSFPRFCCYMFLFPIFTAGPIERFDHFLQSRDP